MEWQRPVCGESDSSTARIQCGSRSGAIGIGLLDKTVTEFSLQGETLLPAPVAFVFVEVGHEKFTVVRESTFRATWISNRCK